MLSPGSNVLIVCLCFFAILKNVYGQNESLGYKVIPIGEYSEDANFNFTELTGNYGYKSEEHTVITKDGYILTLFRIPKGRNCFRPVRKPPVLLLHGLLMSSDSWLDAGPAAGLAYLLADGCYDIWVGNVRGNYYGRRHVRLDPDTDAEFWNFSTHEMGIYDLPAIVDYMLNYTRSPDLMHVGFSQGCRILFTMCSEIAGNCEKIRISINLAPALRLNYLSSLVGRFGFVTYAALAPILKSPSTMEVLPKDGPVATTLSNFCRNEIFAESFCKFLLSFVDSYDPGSVLTETLSKLYDHFPGGTSANTVAIYGQNIISKRFQKYDYGRCQNLKLYGAAQPPLYNLTRASMPVVLIYGKNDFLVNPKDVRWLSGQLPNVLETYEVARPTWNHFDNCYSQYTNLMIFPKINEYLQKVSYV